MGPARDGVRALAFANHAAIDEHAVSDRTLVEA